MSRRSRRYSEASAGGGDVDSSTLVWASVVVASGGTVSSSRRVLVNELITKLKSSGVWANLDRLWLFAAENTQSALIDLKAQSLATAISAPTFVIDRGYAGNGTTSYINTGYVPSTNAVRYALNSAHYGFYNRTNQAASSAATMSANNTPAGNSSEVDLNFTDNSLYFAVNDAFGHVGITAPVDRTGIWIASRIASGTAVLYRSGAQFATNGQTSTGLPNLAFTVDIALAASTGLPDAPTASTNQIASAFIGGGLTAPEATSLTTALQTYMTAVGA